jgi:hypothetical protein
MRHCDSWLFVPIQLFLIQGADDAVWSPPPLWGRVRVGGTASSNRVLGPPTPTLPHKGGGRKTDAASRTVNESRMRSRRTGRWFGQGLPTISLYSSPNLVLNHSRRLAICQPSWPTRRSVISGVTPYVRKRTTEAPVPYFATSTNTSSTERRRVLALRFSSRPRAFSTQVERSGCASRIRCRAGTSAILGSGKHPEGRSRLPVRLR